MVAPTRLRPSPARCFFLVRAEPAGYLNAVTKAPLPGTPAKRLLFQYGLGDAQVSWLGAFFMARSTDAKLFRGNVAEANETLYGFDFADGQVTDGSIATGWSFGAPAAPRENTPPDGAFDTHEDVRRDARAQEQMHSFFSSGIIPDLCGGTGCYGTAKHTALARDTLARVFDGVAA